MELSINVVGEETLKRHAVVPAPLLRRLPLGHVCLIVTTLHLVEDAVLEGVEVWHVCVGRTVRMSVGYRDAVVLGDGIAPGDAGVEEGGLPGGVHVLLIARPRVVLPLGLEGSLGTDLVVGEESDGAVGGFFAKGGGEG